MSKFNVGDLVEFNDHLSHKQGLRRRVASVSHSYGTGQVHLEGETGTWTGLTIFKVEEEKEEAKKMANELARLSDVKQSVLYKLRLNKLDETSRQLQTNGIVNNDGFLTVEGAQVFLDALWQRNPDIQKEIAAELKKIKKEKKDADK